MDGFSNPICRERTGQKKINACRTGKVWRTCKLRWIFEKWTSGLWEMGNKSVSKGKNYSQERGLKDWSPSGSGFVLPGGCAGRFSIEKVVPALWWSREGRTVEEYCLNGHTAPVCEAGRSRSSFTQAQAMCGEMERSSGHNKDSSWSCLPSHCMTLGYYFQAAHVNMVVLQRGQPYKPHSLLQCFRMTLEESNGSAAREMEILGVGCK